MQSCQQIINAVLVVADHKAIGRDEPTCNDCPAGTSDHIEADILHAAIIAVMKEDHIAIKRIANGPEPIRSQFW